MESSIIMDQIILKSVGSYIQTDGIVGPLMANGLPDLTTEGTHVNDVDKEWMLSLSGEDLSAIQGLGFRRGAWRDTLRLIYRKEGKPRDDAERDISNLDDMTKEEAIDHLMEELAMRIL